MDKTYNPAEIEQHWYQIWERMNFFAPKGESKPYCIMIPPPNVTGTLHMGHAFQNTLMDALIRYHRMQGDRTLWQVGTDHAGIATQVVVERLLEKEGTNRKTLGREAFVKRAWEWKETSGNRITQQLRRMGASVDWARERFTMDEQLSEVVQTVFIQLYEEGLIYRGQRLVNWDPVLRSALSDLEVISEESKGSLWYIRYPFVNGQGHLVVATTRPETMLGDVAVAVHPEDPRYKSLIGQFLKLPLTDRTIPIIADDTVEQTFGSGCVKITPAHDFNDYQTGKRHNLPSINIFTIDAKLNAAAPETYQGLDRFEARKQILNDLTAADLIDKTEPHTLKVPKSDRSGAVVEPFLTEQWFVKVAPLAKPAIEAVENGSIKFVPENWSKTYFEWMHNIEDWCISRQLWWGHRIPAWYDESGKIYVGKDEATVRQAHKLSSDLLLKQDEDVLDTWFSSALWPFSTLGWPEKTPEFKTFYPTSVLVTGFDIIFFWVARMIMMGLKFTGQAPFHEVYIHGLVRDAEGQKMSKSKGNILDPIDLVDGIDLDSLVAKNTASLLRPQDAEKVIQRTKKQYPNGIPAFGADALRFTFCALAATGRDIRFDLNRIEGYRNFCNKLWNATRFTFMEKPEENQSKELTVADRWIVSRLHQATKTIREAFDHYRFDLAAQTLYQFVWNEFCDWYLEFSKLPNSHTRQTLVETLESILRLSHPIIPFITESLWQQVAPKLVNQAASVMLETYPTFNTSLVDTAAEKEIEWLQHTVTAIRTIRSEMNISPAKQVPILLRRGSETDKAHITQFETRIKILAKVDNLQWLTAETTPPAATALTGDLEILMPLKGLVDKAAEIARLQKVLAKHQQALEHAEKKLADAHFRANAPANILEQEQERLATSQKAILHFSKQLSMLQQME